MCVCKTCHHLTATYKLGLYFNSYSPPACDISRGEQILQALFPFLERYHEVKQLQVVYGYIRESKVRRMEEDETHGRSLRCDAMRCMLQHVKPRGLRPKCE